MKRVLIFAVMVLMCISDCPAQALEPYAVAPVIGEVVRPFDPPSQPWLSGHRGVDISSNPGTQVVAAMDGVVRFAGVVADRPVISISHGELITTYEPVSPVVKQGDHVSAGHVIGVLVEGHSCIQPTCLHWGLKKGDEYLDPLSLLGGGKIRLITAEAVDEVRRHAEELLRSGWDGQISDLGLINPTSGVITSPYGMRVHPISGEWRFHDGLDLANSCGTPLIAVAPGQVSEVYYHYSYGWRLFIDHGTVNGQRLTTGYNHAQGYTANAGQMVQQGQVLGWMGTTGDSTGCHLHFQVWMGGNLIDPMSVLP